MVSFGVGMYTAGAWKSKYRGHRKELISDVKYSRVEIQQFSSDKTREMSVFECFG